MYYICFKTMRTFILCFYDHLSPTPPRVSDMGDKKWKKKKEEVDDVVGAHTYMVKTSHMLFFNNVT